MTRKLKTLGLALVAVFAMSAVVASAASAQFQANSYPVTITAHSNTPQVFNAGASKVTCNKIAVDITQEEESSELEAVPSYSECNVQEGETKLNAHVHMNSCYYLFTSSGSVHIKCGTEGDKIEVRATFLGERQCLDISEQTPTTPTIDYENTGEGTTEDVNIVSTVNGVTAVKTGVCGSGSTSSNYEGEVTLTGEDPITLEHIGIRG